VSICRSQGVRGEVFLCFGECEGAYTGKNPPSKVVGAKLLVFYRRDIHGYMVPSKYNTNFC